MNARYASVTFAASTQAWFEVDLEKAALAGVAPEQITWALARLLPGSGREPIIAHAHPPGKRSPVPIKLAISSAQRITPAFLERAYATNNDDRHIPLSEFTRVVETLKAKPVNH